MFTVVNSPSVNGALRTDKTPGQGEHQASSQHPEHASQQQSQSFNILLHYLISLGTTVFIILSATAKNVEVIISVGTVEASVPLTNIVNISRAVLGAQHRSIIRVII